MTTKFELIHEFPDISLELFEKHLNHPELNKMLAKMPAFRSRDLIDKDESANGTVNWTFKVVAGGEIPISVNKFISEDMFAWWENSRFVPEEHCIHFEISPLFSKKFEGRGKWQLERSEQGTKRIISGEMSVKVPFVGKLVEAFFVKELKSNYTVEPDIQNAFYKKMTQ